MSAEDVSFDFSDEVCSLFEAQKLKYLGVMQKSLHCYYNSQSLVDGKWNDGVTLTYRTAYQGDASWCAFTVRELGELLPARIVVTWCKNEEGNPLGDLMFSLIVERCTIFEDDKPQQVWVLNYRDEYQIGQQLIVNKLFPHNVYDKKEADARAKLLIQLIEAGFLKVA